MIVQVDFFKETGKWYAGGEVDVGEARLWKGDMAKAISQNQQIVGHPAQFYCVVSEAAATPDTEFVTALYAPGRIPNRKEKK